MEERPEAGVPGVRDQQTVEEDIYGASDGEILRAYRQVTLLPQIEIMISGTPRTLKGIVTELRAEYAPGVDWTEAEWTRQVRRRLRILERVERVLHEHDTYIGVPSSAETKGTAMIRLLFAPELGETARRGLEAGNIIFTAILDYNLDDFTPAIAQWTAAAEKELALKFFADFRYWLVRESSHRGTSLRGVLDTDLDNEKTRDLARYVTGRYQDLTIGQMQRFVSYLHGKNTSRNSWVVAELLKYAKETANPPFFIESDQAPGMLLRLNDEFRKDSHHMNRVFTASEAQECRDLTVSFLQGLLTSCRTSTSSVV